MTALKEKYQSKILLAEDEEHIAFNLILNLEAEGYQVVHAKNGREALTLFEENPESFDLILLDVMMPDIDGYQVARQIRSSNQQTGILMLTAKSSEDDRIQGFRSGVDDYLTKPFSLAELLLRVKRMLVRNEFYANPEASTEELIEVGSLKLDTASLKFDSPLGHYNVTDLEAKVLKEFMTHPNRVLTREHLLTHVWGIKSNIETRTVDNFIVRLRKLLEREPSTPEILTSVRGKGYKLNVQL